MEQFSEKKELAVEDNLSVEDNLKLKNFMSQMDGFRSGRPDSIFLTKLLPER